MMTICSICEEETVFKESFGMLKLCDKCRKNLEDRFEAKNKTKWELGGADPLNEE